MGLNDRAETVAEAKESKEARSEGVEQTVQDAHGEKALGNVQAQQASEFVALKTNIDKVKVGDKEVDLKDGKHEKERGAIKDAAKAMEKGDMAAVQKAFDGLSPEQAKVVAAGLDKALRPGAAVSYDGESKAIEFYTNPAKIGNSSSDKVMVPTDGGTPQKGKGSTFYDTGEPQVNKDAESKDLKNVMDQARKGDADRKAAAGLMSDSRMSAAPMEAAPTFKDAAPQFKDVPPPPNIEVRSGRDLDRADLKEEGITRTRDTQGPVTSSEVKFPNGVEVQNGKDTTPRDGESGSRVKEVSTHMVVVPEGAEQRADGTVVDKKTGRPIAKEMEDGSTRVWTDKGVYNVYPNGEVTKETAIKNRDGSWKILNVKDPLGDMKVPKF